MNIYRFNIVEQWYEEFNVRKIIAVDALFAVAQGDVHASDEFLIGY